MITIDQIDFSLLKPYDGKVDKCFEQLCYQIAQKEFGHLGKFTPIDGSGGDGGVEFYLKLENGEKWGWQCKFFGGNGRLKDSNRKIKIKNSLETACRNHKDLIKWFLCLKTDLTQNTTTKTGKEKKGEQDWFDIELPKQIPPDRSIELEHWGETRILSFLNSPNHVGIRSFFFGSLEFSKEWFEKRFYENFEKVKGKYDDKLHTIDQNTQAAIDLVLLNSSYLELVDEFEEEFERNVKKLQSSVQDFRKIKTSSKNESSLKTAFLKYCEGYKEHMSRILNFIQELKQRFHDNDLPSLPFDFKKHDTDYFSYRSDSISDFKKESEFYKKAGDVYYNYGNIGGHFRDFFDKYINPPKNEIHFLADAAKGKTHLSADIGYKRIINDKPAILLTGDKFTNESSILEALKKNLDIPVQYSVEEFIQALDIYGSITKTKIPIIIDALNETTSDRTFSSIWQDHLVGFSKKLSETKNLVLITTCRTSYKDRVYENESDNFHYLRGFENFEVLEEAVGKYFTKFRIVPTQSFSYLQSLSSLFQTFSTPLFLLIFCEVKNPNWTDNTEAVVNLDEESTFGVFDNYLVKVNERVATNNPIIKKGEKFVQENLFKIAKHLWDNNLREIKLDDFYNLIDENQPYQKDLSKADILISEGLVINRNLRDDEEQISFTYDLMAGYLIAKHIISSKDVRVEKLCTENFTSRFISGKNQHPLFEDIMYSLSLLLPQLKQKYLHETLKVEEEVELDKEFTNFAFEMSVQALFRLPAEHVRNDTHSFIVDLFNRHQKNQSRLFELSLKTLTDIKHPLNALLFCNLLADMEMNERDLSWSEFIREKSRTFESIILEFENQCKLQEIESDVLIQKQHILARYISWVLTSTNRKLRDLATRSLYFYGRKFPTEFSALVYESLKVDDPYVWERTLASLYGVCMAKHTSPNTDEFRNKILPEIAQNIYDLIFSEKAPHSTTHILARDYARRIIEISLLYKPDQFSAKEIERIRPPYEDGGIRELGEFNYENLEISRFNPIQMDFSNYTLGRIVKDGHSYSDPPEKKKVRRQIYWRIFELGWDEELFKDAEFSIGISTRHDLRNDRPKIERYGKKYAWIAYLENAGLRKDLGLLEKEWDDFRISDVDIDPSFPANPPEEILLTEDLLGDRTADLLDWYNDGGLPDIDHYLIVNGLKDSTEKWVCLDGYVNQEDKEVSRGSFTFIRSFLVKEEDYGEVIELLKKQDLGNRWLPEKLENYYSFAGELYYCEGATHDNITEFEFLIGKRIIKIKKGDPDYRPNQTFDFVDNQLIVKTEEPEQIVKEVSEVKKIQTLLPVMDYNWENYHSDLNSAGNMTVVSKEIANKLDLVNQPQTFDLFEKDGSKASMNLQFGSGFNNRQYFVYLRKDLLDRFLQENKMKFIHAIWGEREVRFEDHSKFEKFRTDNSINDFKVFQKIIEYPK